MEHTHRFQGDVHERSSTVRSISPERRRRQLWRSSDDLSWMSHRLTEPVHNQPLLSRLSAGGMQAGRKHATSATGWAPLSCAATFARGHKFQGLIAAIGPSITRGLRRRPGTKTHLSQSWSKLHHVGGKNQSWWRHTGDPPEIRRRNTTPAGSRRPGDPQDRRAQSRDRLL